jgi:hypothetical protein
MEADMSRFDITHTNKDPDEWSQIAYQRVGQNNLQAHVFGGFALAATVAVMSTPITGALVAAYVLWTAVEKGRSQSKNFDAVDKGAIAHVLEESEFRAYARQVGSEKLNEELTFALQEDYKLSDTAMDYLENAGITTELTHELPLLPTTLTTTSGDYNPQYSIDLPEELTNRITNTIIVGVPGSGKGMMLANSIRAIKKKFPGHKIFMIDPKGDGDEAAYFDGIVDRFEANECEHWSASEVINWIKWCFGQYHEYAEKNGKCLLILDEIVVVGLKFVEEKDDFLKDQISVLASFGDKKGKNIWVCSQTPFVKPLGLDINTVALMTTVGIVRDSGIMAQWNKAGLKFAKVSPAEITLLIKKSEEEIGQGRGRAIYFSKTGKWYAMPKMVNYSSYDRDTGERLQPSESKDALSKSDRSSLRSATNAITTKTKPEITAQVITKVARTKFDNLNDFIKHELKTEVTDEIKLAVVATIRGRTDLLEKFNLGWLAIKDPIEALKLWASESKTNEQIREAWLLHTSQHLNDQGIKHLREKLEK